MYIFLQLFFGIYLQEKRVLLKIQALCAKYCMQFTVCYAANSLSTAICFFVWTQHDFLKIICKKREYLRADLLSGILKPLLHCCFLSILFKWLTVFVLKITIIPEYINDGRKSYILIVLE
jgi:hypothetical protein